MLVYSCSCTVVQTTDGRKHQKHVRVLCIAKKMPYVYRLGFIRLIGKYNVLTQHT